MSGGLPARVAPMLATPGPVPSGSGWAFEFKWDGVRAVAAVAGDQIRVQSRNDKPLIDSYPELGTLRDLLDRPTVLDGEVVVLDDQGRPDFGLLQARMHVRSPSPELLSSAPVLYYVFDLLHLDGTDLTRRSTPRVATFWTRWPSIADRSGSLRGSSMSPARRSRRLPHSMAWRASSPNGSNPATNPVDDRRTGSRPRCGSPPK